MSAVLLIARFGLLLQAFDCVAVSFKYGLRRGFIAQGGKKNWVGGGLKQLNYLQSKSVYRWDGRRKRKTNSWLKLILGVVVSVKGARSDIGIDIKALLCT